MPLKTWNTKADWDAAYGRMVETWGHPGGRPGLSLNYHRAAFAQSRFDRAAQIAALLGWTAPGPVLVVYGAGFGWLAEGFERIGFTRVVGTDTSTYIQATRLQTEEADIDAALNVTGVTGAERTTLKGMVYDGGVRDRTSRGVLNEDGLTGRSRNNIRASLGLSGNQQPDWVLTDSVLESLADAEAVSLASSLRGWVPALIHGIVPLLTEASQDPGFNWKAPGQWKTLLTADRILDLVRGTVTA